jgi:hypothetical protein
VKIREYAFMHVYTRLFTHRALTGKLEKTHIKNDVYLYAYILIRVYASFGRHPIIMFNKDK